MLCTIVPSVFLDWFYCCLLFPLYHIIGSLSGFWSGHIWFHLHMLPLLYTLFQMSHSAFLVTQFNQTLAQMFLWPLFLQSYLHWLKIQICKIFIFIKKNPNCSGENKIQVSGWIIALVSSLVTKIGDKRTETLFSKGEIPTEPVPEKKRKINLLSRKLDRIAICLKLSPYDSRGNYKGKLLPISRHEIEPAYVICPTSFICGTLDCQPRCLVQSTWEHDIPMVALIKGHSIPKCFCAHRKMPKV